MSLLFALLLVSPAVLPASGQGSVEIRIEISAVSPFRVSFLFKQSRLSFSSSIENICSLMALFYTKKIMSLKVVGNEKESGSGKWQMMGICLGPW
jgi:hypothetical protein